MNLEKKEYYLPLAFTASGQAKRKLARMNSFGSPTKKNILEYSENSLVVGSRRKSSYGQSLSNCQRQYSILNIACS